MSHPVNDEHLEIISASLTELLWVFNNLTNHIEKYELHSMLKKKDVVFLNQVKKAIERYTK